MAKKFKYTDQNSKFKEEEKEFYEENGYLVVKNIADHRILDEMKQRFIDISEGRIKDHRVFAISKDPSLKAKGIKGEYAVNKIQSFLYDEELFKYCTQDRILDVVENIIGPNIIACHSMIINKPPNGNPSYSQHPLHQDLLYFPFRPADRIVAAWTAMEDVNENNGCLFVVPGSHKNDTLYDHDYLEEEKHKGYQGVHGFDHLKKVNLVVDKGDTVFFHPLLLHGSKPNLSNGFRKAVTVHFADSDCQFIEVTGTKHEKIARDLGEQVVKLGGPKNYSDFWKVNARLIRGSLGKFELIPPNDKNI